MPSLACAATSAQRASTRWGPPWVAGRRSALYNAPGSAARCPVCSCLASMLAPTLTSPLLPLRSVDLSSTFYALNPSGDLTATQSTFQDWFGGMRGWQARVKGRGGG